MDQQNTLKGAEELYKLLRTNTVKSKVTGRKQLLQHPFEGLTKEDMSALLDSLGTETMPEELRDIAVLKGRKDTWYYDGTIMTRHYAELDSMIQEKDILHTIATVVRSDSALYPRPTEFCKLTDTPFWFTEDELLGAAARFSMDPNYQDIGMVQASNGDRGFFSSQSLTRDYAEALFEWNRVGSFQNP